MKKQDTKGVEPIGLATPEQIEGWKKKHGKVFVLSGNGSVCYIRKPDFNEVDYATSVSINSPLSFPKEIINQTFLGGCEEFKENVDFIMGVSAVIDSIVETVVVEVKEA